VASDKPGAIHPSPPQQVHVRSGICETAASSTSCGISNAPLSKRREIFGKFKSHRQAQRFLAAHDQINLIFHPRRYQVTAASNRHARSDAFSFWADYTAELAA
jgi:hypothetical protein